ncbi:MAG: universal stress protein [Dehalococcoidia bacterium]
MYDPIIIAVDGSELAEEAIPHGAAMARDFNAEILIVRAVEMPHEYYDVAPYMSPRVSEEMIDETVRQAEEYVAATAENLRERGLTVHGRIRLGDPATTILEAADEHRGGVIVIATHGRSGLTRWAMGSVADRVVRHAPIPVLLIRSAQPIPAVRPVATDAAND